MKLYTENLTVVESIPVCNNLMRLMRDNCIDMLLIEHQ